MKKVEVCKDNNYFSVVSDVVCKGYAVPTLRPANLRGGQLCEIVNGAIVDSMITYMILVKRGQKSQANLGGAIA